MTGANDRTLRLLNTDSGKPRVLQQHESGVTAAVWMDDEHMLTQQYNRRFVVEGLRRQGPRRIFSWKSVQEARADVQGLIVSGSNTGEIFVWF